MNRVRWTNIVGKLISVTGITVLGARSLFVCTVLLLIMSVNLYKDYPNTSMVFSAAGIYFAGICTLIYFFGWLGLSKSGQAMLHENSKLGTTTTTGRVFKVMFASFAMAGGLQIILGALLIVIERADLITGQSLIWTFYMFAALSFPFVYKHLK